jgi:hypothetical protein
MASGKITGLHSYHQQLALKGKNKAEDEDWNHHPAYKPGREGDIHIPCSWLCLYSLGHGYLSYSHQTI